MATDAERLWPALSDDELAASAALVTTTATVTTTQQRLLLPSPAGELSAFLGAGASSSGAQNFLDDLLSDDADAAQPSQSFQLLQGHEDGAVAGAMSDGGVLSDAAFFSLGEEQRAEQSTSYSSSASGSPTTGANASRLLQLETNYERKKKRAKINRKDLNSRFQELMDILHLKEDRKLNRAKILEKTIEHIEKLTAELNALKAGHQPQQGLNQTQQTHARKTAVALQHPHQFHGITSAMAHSMGHHSATSSAHANVSTGAPILPFNPSHNHPWSAAGVGTSLPLAQMMWIPCPVVTSSGMMLKRAAPGRPIDTSTRKRGRVESVESVTTTVSEPATSSSEIESVPETSDVMMTSVSSVEKDASMFVWSALEIPTLLSYCDAWTLTTVMRVSRELRHAATSDKLWADLSRERWRLPFTTSITQPRQQWQQWHALNRIPDCSAFTPGGFLFASGRTKNIGLWGLLSHRSNGHTTRTVLLNGKATVMQVVEVYIVVQNLSRSRVCVTDCISLTGKTLQAGTGETKPSFQPFTASSGAHLMPQVVAFNSEPCATKDLSTIALQHGDLCVLSVFMACPGLNLEDQFLQRAGWLNVQCERNARGEIPERVNVRAASKDHNDYDRTREKAMQAVRRSNN